MDDEEVMEKIEDWFTNQSTPYAPYITLHDWLGWTTDEYSLWMRTGKIPDDE